MLFELVMPRNKAHRAKGVAVPTPNQEEGERPTVVFTPGVDLPGYGPLEGAFARHLDGHNDSVVLRPTSDIVDSVTDQVGVAYLSDPGGSGVTYGTVKSPTGLDCYSFSGSSLSFLTSTVGAVIPQPITVYLAGRLSEATAFQKFFFDAASGVDTFRFFGADGWRITAGDTLTLNQFYDTDWHVWDMVFNGAESELRVDGVKVVGNAGTHGLIPIRVGAGTAGGDRLKGSIGELAVHAGIHSAGVRNRNLWFLQNKWLTGTGPLKARRG